MRARWLAGVVALVLAHTMASAQAARNDIGFLTCSLADSEEIQGGTTTLVTQTRDILCSFRPLRSGPEETYTGSLQTMGSEQEASALRAMIWVVKIDSGTEISPGMLEQVYAADPTAPPGQEPPLIGDSNKLIVLQSMTEKERPAAAGKRPEFAAGMIIVVALKLRSAST